VIGGIALTFWSGNSSGVANTSAPNELATTESFRIFMRAEGETQGEIKGGVEEAGKEDWIFVSSIHHSVVSPRDAASGLPTGERQHKPITITKVIDQATPLLYQALAVNEKLYNVSITFYRKTDLSAVEEAFFEIRLEDAYIASIQNYVPRAEDAIPMEEVSFTYTKIVWTHLLENISSSDTWSSIRTGF
jgi:type VI secretion system secreted protein Hcp